MYATVHWAERKSRRKKQKEGEEDTVPHSLRSNARNRTKRVVWKSFLPFFIAIQFTRETNLSFFHDVEKEILEIFALENCIIVSWNFSLFFFFLFFSRKRNNEIIRKNFHFFFFFLRSREFRRVVLILIRDNLSKFEKTLESRYYSFALKILMRLLFLSTC